MTRKEVRIVVLALALTIIPDGYYCVQIIQGSISPALATWVVGTVAILLALISYRTQNEGEHPFVTSLGNHIDPLVVGAIVLCIVVTGNGNRTIDRFDGWCLVGAAGIVVAWFIAKYATRSGKLAAQMANILSNGLLLVGYGPTWHRLLVRKQNTESFVL